MEVHLNPDLQAKLNKLATESGRSTDELVEGAIVAYVDELAQTRDMLNSRYDDLRKRPGKAGRRGGGFCAPESED